MRRKLPRLGGVGMAVAAALLLLLAAGRVEPVATQKNQVAVSTSTAMLPIAEKESLNASEYWTEDHPYMYKPRFRRLPDGRVVPSNMSTFENTEDFRDAVAKQTPWLSKWTFSAKNQRADKKDLSRLLMYTMVSPMDYGSSLRSQNVRRRRNKAATAFATDNLALPILKTLGRVVWNLIENHYVGYFKDQISAQRLDTMTASEMYDVFNLTQPADDSGFEKDFHSNLTRAYEYDGQSRRALLYARYTVGFSPYDGYSERYYDRDDDLPMPMLPADSYPWLWTPRLNLARHIALQLMQSIAKEDAEEATSSHPAGDEEVDPSVLTLEDASTPSARSLQQLVAAATPAWLASDGSADSGSQFSGGSAAVDTSDVEAGDDSADGDIDAADGDAISEQDIQTLKDLQLHLQEYHFATGVPRFALHSNEAHTIFPSLTTFMQKSQFVSIGGDGSNQTDAYLASVFESSGSANLGDPESGGGLGDHVVSNASFANITRHNGTDLSGRVGVYTALTHFYVYLSVNKWMVSSDDRFPDDAALVSACLVDSPCLVQSGVTVYTPSLPTLTLFTAFDDPIMTAASKRALRLTTLQEMIQVAFEAEERALKHGLQAPSTVWYSKHDLDVDEFADAVLGSVNMSVSGQSADTTPLHVFKSLMVDKTAVLDQVTSYYADTNHDTKVAMEINNTVPALDQFNESEVAELVELFGALMQAMEQAIATYTDTRGADAQYREVINATARGDLYNGSQYTLLGFGFVILATNDLNVLYRDTKLPVPFHLVLRLLIRFQESHLLLPEESRHLLSCLAMLVYDISFYRCRTRGS